MCGQVVFLELLLGTSEVFQIDERTKAIINHRLRRSSLRELEAAYLLRALTEYCIYPPRSLPRSMLPSHIVLIADQCSAHKFADQIARRDPAALGPQDQWAAKLIMRLLSWNHFERPSAARVLQHAYLRDGGSQGWLCAKTGEEFEFEDEMLQSCQ